MRTSDTMLRDTTDPLGSAIDYLTLSPVTLDEYLQSIIHAWSKTLTALGFTLIPIFFILDHFMMPAELLTRFALYRLAATSIVVAQFFVLQVSRPSRWSIFHGYFFSMVVAGMIALMTTDLGGFDSTYYAGLNLVMIAANLLLPWRAVHSAINSLFIVGLYLVINLVFIGEAVPKTVLVINNLYFLTSTAIISVAINFVKERLIRQEFLARSNLQSARDALWGEMEVAKHIQTALLPKVESLGNYRVAAATQPAAEVGGDYHDIIRTDAGETWLAIGDVSGHGVESGLIMMMTQTSIFTAINQTPNLRPSDVLRQVNSVLTENISRLGTDRYMTLSAIALRGDQLEFAGKHQDILVYRRARGAVETVPTVGTWLGVVSPLGGHVHDAVIPIDEGDIVLLFTDGVTEATNDDGDMFGEDALRRALARYASLEVDQIVRNIVRDLEGYMRGQRDDFTLVALQRAGRPARGAR